MNYYVICEGKSENNYLNLLNRYFRDNSTEKRIIVKTLCGVCNMKLFRDTVKELSKSRPDKIYLWLDFDCFQRKDKDAQKIEQEIGRINKNRKRSFVEILFSKMNFEDFLSMHYQTECEKLQKQLTQHGHFDCPLHSTEYIPIFTNIFTEYTKGNILFENITEEYIKNLLQNQHSVSCKFKCDLVDILFS